MSIPVFRQESLNAFLAADYQGFTGNPIGGTRDLELDVMDRGNPEPWVETPEATGSVVVLESPDALK